MPISIYNVLTKKREEFIPMEEGKVKMYACGITVSGDAHIGHAYQAVIFDVIKKYLEHKGYEVTYVRNYTDVDDKIIAKANELGINAKDYADKQMIKTDLEFQKLGIKKPTIQAKATENIKDMINFISKLIEKEYAYSTEFGDVFFSVKKFSQYGKLSNRVIEDNINGVRKSIEPGKLADEDFALWKSAKPNEIYWESPWGKGRPGWHIECSTMSMKYLGETIDIHGGGKDLIFPHHENEIAQSEALTGKQFSNYWIHNGLVKINGEKMSKSLGNSISLEDLLNKYHPEVIKFVILQNNYKSDLNIIEGVFDEFEKHIYSFYKTLYSIDNLQKDSTILNDSLLKETYLKIEKPFDDAMSNDFNTALAISHLFKYFKNMQVNLSKKGNYEELLAMKEGLIKVYSILGLLQDSPKKVISEIQNKYLLKNNITKEEVENLISKRSEYKNNKDYENADKIKTLLLEKGIVLFDRKDFTNWDVNLG